MADQGDVLDKQPQSSETLEEVKQSMAQFSPVSPHQDSSTVFRGFFSSGGLNQGRSMSRLPFSFGSSMRKSSSYINDTPQAPAPSTLHDSGTTATRDVVSRSPDRLEQDTNTGQRETNLLPPQRRPIPTPPPSTQKHGTSENHGVESPTPSRTHHYSGMMAGDGDASGHLSPSNSGQMHDDQALVFLPTSSSRKMLSAGRNGRGTEMGILGNTEVENELAATMMNLAGHIQQQNSSRQRRLEELTEELNRARLCIQEQAETISKLKENSQVVISAITGQREKIQLNQDRIEIMKKSCKLYQITIKNLGKVIKEVEADKAAIVSQLEQNKKEHDTLNAEREDLKEKLAKNEEAAIAMQLSFSKQIDALGTQNERLVGQLSESVGQSTTLREQLERKLEEHAVELKRKQEQYDIDRNFLEKDNERLQGELNELRQTYMSHQEESTLLVANNRAEIVSLEAKIGVLESREGELLGSKSRLEDEIHKLTKKVLEMETCAAKADERYAELLSSLQQNKELLERKEEEWQSKLHEMRTVVQNAEQRARDAEAEAERLRRELTDEKERFTFEVNTLKSFGQELDSRHAENIAALEQIRESQSRELERLNESNQELSRSIKEVQGDRLKLEEEHERAMDEMRRSARQRELEFDEKYRQHDLQREHLERELASQRESLAALEKDKSRLVAHHEKELKETAEQHRREQMSAAEELKKIQVELAETEMRYQTAQSVNRELFDMKPKQATLAKRVKELEQELASCKVHLSAAQRDVDTTRQQCTQRESEFALKREQMNEEVRCLTVAKESLEAYKQKTMGEIEKLSEEIKQLQGQLSDQKSKNDLEISQLKKQFDSAEKRRECDKINLQAKVNTLRNEKESLSSLSKQLEAEKANLQGHLIEKIGQNEALLAQISSLRKAGYENLELNATQDDIPASRRERVAGAEEARNTDDQGTPVRAITDANKDNVKEKLTHGENTCDPVTKEGTNVANTSSKEKTPTHKKFRSPVRTASTLALKSDNAQQQVDQNPVETSPKSNSSPKTKEPRKSPTKPSLAVDENGKRQTPPGRWKKPPLQPAMSFSAFSQIETMDEDAEDDRIDQGVNFALDELVTAVDADNAISQIAEETTVDQGVKYLTTPPKDPQKNTKSQLTSDLLDVAKDHMKSPERSKAVDSPKKPVNIEQTHSDDEPSGQEMRRSRPATSSAQRSTYEKAEPKKTSKGANNPRKRRISTLNIIGGKQQDNDDDSTYEEPRRGREKRHKKAERSPSWSSSRSGPARATKSRKSTLKPTAKAGHSPARSPKKRQPVPSKANTDEFCSPEKPKRAEKSQLVGKRTGTPKSPTMAETSITTTTTIHKTQRVYSTQSRKEKAMGRATSVRATKASASRRHLAAFDTSSEDFAAALMTDDALFGWPPA
ncbi:hypothetical protein SpCBS45565_g01935 [Spizellomyces sp. 'palustris']|nr:hypothetical protein SpCBS45565_g01935 [Spizellomyces sp. 'palustris']